MASPKLSGGFTLIELVMSLFVLGLVSGAIILTLPSQESHEQSEADRLAARLSAASNHSILSGEVVGAAVSENGYRFYRLVQGEWTELKSEPLTPQTFSPDTGLAFSLSYVSPVIEPVARLNLEAAPSKAMRPNIVFYPMGLNTPFSISIGGGEGEIKVESRGAGLVVSGESDAS